MTKLSTAIAAAIAVVLLSACSETPTSSTSSAGSAKANEAASSAPVTAIAAYWKMYESAYKWAPDEILLRLEPKDVPAFTDGDGKAGIWQATFASPSKREFRQFMYATAARPPDIYRGVTVGNGIPWGGVTREVMPIEKSQFTVDSDSALSTARDDAKTWLSKNPHKALSNFQLGNGYSFPAPVWYAMWGDKKSGYVVYINATTGKVMKK